MAQGARWRVAGKGNAVGGRAMGSSLYPLASMTALTGEQQTHSNDERTKASSAKQQTRKQNAHTQKQTRRVHRKKMLHRPRPEPRKHNDPRNASPLPPPSPNALGYRLRPCAVPHIIPYATGPPPEITHIVLLILSQTFRAVLSSTLVCGGG